MIKVFFNSNHQLHVPSDDYVGGQWYPYVEVPERIDASLAALETVEGLEIIEASSACKRDILQVHDQVLIDSLENISRGLKKGEVHQALPFREKIFADLSAPVTAGTFKSACGAAGCALDAAQAVLDGGSFAIALCRPPGHHAGKAFCGGYCYFNNAALAAQKLLSLGRAGILDLDYHHGHGTQDIFYQRSDVIYVSLHADPAVEYPYRWGFTHERGEGAGEGYNLNLPLAPDCGEEIYLQALRNGLEFLSSKEIKSLVVSLGFDTHVLDPYRGLGLNEKSYCRISRFIGELRLPMVAVFEGGYNLSVLGECWKSFISGLE